MSDSDSTSSYGSDYKNFRQSSRERLLHEMLRSSKTGDSKSTWKVLIMDKLTVKVMSYSCKMADITDEVVEDIYRRRQPLPSMDAIYFIQPSRENVIMLLSDMAGKAPLYRKAFIFFSSPISRELVNHIKKDATILPRIVALKEMNLEYFAIDSQGFITNNERALEDLLGDEENTRKGVMCLNVMATRIATVFASLREFPMVRYRAAKSLDATTMTTFRDLIPTKLAAGVWDCIMKYKSLPGFPKTETCELLILDRSVDQIAPIIHEWTYDAICHDLLNLEGNKYVQEVPGKTGELSTRDLQKMVQALPQYSEQIDKLSLHVEIAGKINGTIRELGLRELGQLEQDLVFGDAGMKDVIKFLTTKEDTTRENKLRLLMVLAAIYPDKFEGEKGLNIMKLAKLPPEDMNAVHNLRLLGGSSDTKKSSTGTFSLKFDMHKKKRAARKDRTGEQETWQLSRFYPMIEELIEKLHNGELSKDDYPCLNDPSQTFHGTSQTAAVNHAPVANPAQSKRTHKWARPRNSDDGYSSDSILRHASSDFKKMGQRIFVFIIGGATRSELRVCHKLTTKLKREVVLGSSSIDDPPQFITKLKMLTAHELSIDDLQI
ncbi:snare-interacting protein keule [Quercus suber]|uniref:Snare-interacting protein keule n=1 Tax=Quercus suber TaxID=58331 RepID=A0AAW0M156_QUESU